MSRYGPYDVYTDQTALNPTIYDFRQIVIICCHGIPFGENSINLYVSWTYWMNQAHIYLIAQEYWHTGMLEEWKNGGELEI